MMLRELHQKNRARLVNHIANNHKRIHKHMTRIHKHVTHTSHVFLYFGEMIMICAMGFWSMMHAGSSNLPNNTSFTYPLKMVSTVECRTLYWEDMPDSCKINLPIIKGANYTVYAGNSLYRSIYTTLWAAPYSDTWNQTKGAHAGIDVATARGTPIYSIGNGVVFFAGRNSSYGNVIKVKYVYKGEIIYAVYAHLDTIEVSEGATVTKGQKIGTTGNSGNTFGALGGYHLHFEIDKNNGGRPAYSYTNCADVSKGHYTIIQNGLCREELFKYQYDPIKVLEGVSDLNGISVGTQTTPVNEIENDDKNIVIENKAEPVIEVVELQTGHNSATTDTNVKEDQVSTGATQKVEEKIDDKKVDEVKNEDKNTPQTVSNQNSNVVDEKTGNINNGNTNIVNNQQVVENNQQNVEQNIQEQGNQNNQNQEIVDTNIENNNEKDPLVIDLNFDKLTGMGKHFMTQWDVEMKSELNKRSLRLGETLTIDVEVFKKGMTNERTGNYLNGILQTPFEFINSTNGISLNINTLQLLTKGKATIEVTGVSVGKSAILINLGGEKIGVLNIEVR